MARRLVAIVQARLGSTRLPGKALLDLSGSPMIAHVLSRAAAISGVDDVVLATTDSRQDDALADFAWQIGHACVRGSVEDVLDRYRAALRAHPADAVVRITGDCPLLDPAVSARVVDDYLRAEGGVDYASNVHPPTYPDGLDTELISAAALEEAWREARMPSDREHVTPFIWRQPKRFAMANVLHSDDLSALRWTVDDARDLEFARTVYEALSPDGTRMFGMDEVLELLRARPHLGSLNAGTRRNEGFERSRLADLAASKGQGS